MNLLEHEAKQILRATGIPVPKSQVIKRYEKVELTLPAVLKSQVPIGGRGKLGGIKIVDDAATLPNVIDDLFALEIKGFKPSVLLAEEKLDIAKEFYLSILIDRASESVQLVAHPAGGVEVESQEAEGFLRLVVSRSYMVDGGAEVVGEQLAELYGTPEQTFALQDLVENLYDCFVKNDATLLEINPLVLTRDGQLVAGDCKMVLDDAAAFRHPDWNFEQESVEANFVTLDPNGTVATIANGAGLAMATVDAVASSGMQPANFLDIGGGANAESVMKAFKRIMEYPNVQAIVINIFAGITRCDEVAKAIIQAKSQFSNLPPLCIRLSGTNYEKAVDLLAAENIPLLPTLEDCLQAAKEYTE